VCRPIHAYIAFANHQTWIAAIKQVSVNKVAKRIAVSERERGRGEEGERESGQSGGVKKLASWRLPCRSICYTLPFEARTCMPAVRIVFVDVVCSNFYLSVIYNPPLTKLDGAAAKSAAETVKMAAATTTTTGVDRLGHMAAELPPGRCWRGNGLRSTEYRAWRQAGPTLAGPGHCWSNVGHWTTFASVGRPRIHFQFISIRLVGLSCGRTGRMQAIRS